MSELDEFMATGYQAWLDAVNAFHQRDIDAWLAVWSTNEPVSVFGALGSNRSGRPDLERLMPGVAAQFVDLGQTDVELVAVEVSGDFAYTVGYERTARKGSDELTVLRVTQIFRRENGEWKLAHRHGDPDPIDQVAATATT